MRIEVLGSSAGGGLPQFNCNCDNCKGYREGKTTIKRRTQSSITISEMEKTGFYLMLHQIF